MLNIIGICVGLMVVLMMIIAIFCLLCVLGFMVIYVMSLLTGKTSLLERIIDTIT